MKWNMIKLRPMDEEERKEFSEKLGYELLDFEAVIFTTTPDDGQRVLVCDKYGRVGIDMFVIDPDEVCYFEDNGDMASIIAWMPLPEPPKEEKE